MNNRQLYQWVKRESKGWRGMTRHFRENGSWSRSVAKAIREEEVGPDQVWAA